MAKTTAKKQLAFTANTELAPMWVSRFEQPFPGHFVSRFLRDDVFAFGNFFYAKFPGAAPNCKWLSLIDPLCSVSTNTVIGPGSIVSDGRFADELATYVLHHALNPSPA
jgi:hypothetical protein